MRCEVGSRSLKVVVAFCRLNPAVREALRRDGIPAYYFNTSIDDEAYWRLLCALWAQKESFILLEQDKVPQPGAIQALWNCPNLWCAYPVPMWQTDRYADFPSLSCVKFDRALMERAPNLMTEQVGQIGIGGGDVPPRHYQRLDMAVALWVQLANRGEVCWHPKGMVRHEHQEVA